jgi:hypothetical protein
MESAHSPIDRPGIQLQGQSSRKYPLKNNFRSSRSITAIQAIKKPMIYDTDLTGLGVKVDPYFSVVR